MAMIARSTPRKRTSEDSANIAKMGVMFGSAPRVLGCHGHSRTSDAESLLHDCAAPGLASAHTDGVLPRSLNEIPCFVNECELARVQGKSHGLRLANIQMDPTKCLQRAERHSRRRHLPVQVDFHDFVAGKRAGIAHRNTDRKSVV